MSDSINALLGIGINTEDELNALAEGLRGRKASADWLSATTVPTLRNVATQQRDDVMAGAERAGGLRRALLDRESQDERARLTRALEQQRINQEGRRIRNAEEEDLTQFGSDAFDRAMKEKEYQLDKEKVRTGYGRSSGTGSRTIKWAKNPDSGEVIQYVMAGGQPIDPNTGQSVNTTGFVPYTAVTGNAAARMQERIPEQIDSSMKLINAIESLDDTMAPYSMEAGAQVAFDDIPGAGAFSGRRDILGKVARLGERAGGLGDTSKVFAASEKLRNILISDQVGRSQTITEVQNQLRNFGLNEILNDPRVFMENIDEIKSVVQHSLRNVIASKPETADAFNDAYATAAEQYGNPDLQNPLLWEPRRLSFANITEDDPRTLGGSDYSRAALLSPEKTKALDLQDESMRIAKEIAELEAGRESP